MTNAEKQALRVQQTAMVTELLNGMPDGVSASGVAVALNIQPSLLSVVKNGKQKSALNGMQNEALKTALADTTAFFETVAPRKRGRKMGGKNAVAVAATTPVGDTTATDLFPSGDADTDAVSSGGGVSADDNTPGGFSIKSNDELVAGWQARDAVAA